MLEGHRLFAADMFVGYQAVQEPRPVRQVKSAAHRHHSTALKGLLKSPEEVASPRPREDIGEEDRLLSRLEGEMTVESEHHADFTMSILDKGNGKAHSV